MSDLSAHRDTIRDRIEALHWDFEHGLITAVEYWAQLEKENELLKDVST